ncbi:MAG: hypothetical protein ACMXYF_01190 [Candidatus Woesearchaeota archaeon]
MILSQKTKQLAQVLSLPAMTGHISILAASGFLTLKNAPLIGLLFIAGPTALFLAATLGGTVKQNVFSVLVASCIATFALVLAAAIGASILPLLDLKLLQITGGIVLIFIAFTLFGLKIPNSIPVGILIAGLLISLIKKAII